MDKSGNETESFETILKSHSEKKPLSIYGAQNCRTDSTSKILKPQDVISAVSRQLRDMQNADCLKKERLQHTTRPRQSEFVPVHVLSREAHPQHKFETQCVTDTQLIDIVDSVEAMVENKGIDEEFETSFCQNDDNKKIYANAVEDKQINIEDSNVRKYLGHINEFRETNASKNEDKPVVDKDQDYSYDINTEVCREFDTSYCKTYNGEGKDINNSSRNVQNINRDELVEEKIVIETVADVVNEDYELENESENKPKNTHSQDSNVNYGYSVADKGEFMHIVCGNVQCKDNIICNDCKVESYASDKILPSSKYQDDKEISLNDEDIFNQIFDEDKHTEDSMQNLECPSSPIFNYYKPKKKLTPLVFELESFEKFESLAMPLIEENLDFEAAKYLINSQIINKELLIQCNTTPAIDKHEDITAKVQNNNTALHSNEAGITKDDTNVKDKEQIENKPCDGFEDEILFSSDEENDYLGHNEEDLPLTCIVETSTCESEVFDLNKTMFVGFQTSCNKPIQVLRESFEKAKSIFNNIEKQTNEDVTLTELVEIYDGNIPKKTNNDNKTICSNLKGMKENLDGVTSKNVDIDPLDVKFFQGFKTANGKHIDISDKALRNCKDIFKDIEGDIFDVDSRDEVSTLNIAARKRRFDGFKTASNKKIRVSEECLTKPNIIFKDIDLTFDNELLRTESEPSNFHKNKDSNIQHEHMCINNDLSGNNKKNDNDDLNIVDQTLLQEFENDSIEEGPYKQDKLNADAFKYIGFNTASDKNIKISDAALKKSENIFKDINNVCYEDLNSGSARNAKKISDLNDFKLNVKSKTETNRITDTSTSIDGLCKAKTYVERTEIDLYFSDICKKDKKYDVGKLHKENNMFKNDDKYESKHPVNRDSNKIASKDNTNIIAENLNNNIFYLPNKNDNVEPSDFIGFKTANNKPVQVSEKALTRTKKIFQDIDMTTDMNIKDSNQNCNLADNVKIKDHNHMEMRLDFQGFTTASNKIINVSEEALLKSRKIFEAIEDTGTCEEQSNITTVNNNLKVSDHMPLAFEGFKTANNKVIKVPEAALLDAKNIFKGIDDSIGNNEKSNNFKNEIKFEGFKAAGNNIVKVSKETLLKSRKILKDLDINDKNSLSNSAVCCANNATHSNIGKDDLNVEINKKSFTGFKTASNKQVKISDAAIAKTKDMFKDLDLDQDVDFNKGDIETCDFGTFKGFQTASNKSVKVSEEAIARSRKIFGGIDYYSKNEDFKENEDITNHTDTNKLSFGTFKGFQTANNKCVEVSKEAIARSRKIFEGIDCDSKNEDFKENEPINKQPDVNIHTFGPFKGFQTASNKCVKVSDDAVARSRKIFEGIDYDSKNEDFKENEHINKQPDMNKHSFDAFKGFQTASNKCVKVSDDAIARSRKIFEGIDYDSKNEDFKENELNEPFNKEADVNKHNFGTFKGFQTASNKSVKVSEEAIARSRKVFEDIGYDTNKEFKENECIKKYTDMNRKVENVPDKEKREFGFKTATNKSIKVSEDSLKKSKQLFAEMENNLSHINADLETKSNVDSKMGLTNELPNLDNILDTQVRDNFEETLYTEDFCKDVTPKQSKRSGSPILSCPKAKKRKKFETPYRNDKSTFKVQSVVNNIKTTATKYTFVESYKKTKLYTLKELDDIDKNNKNDYSTKIDPYILNFEFDSLTDFEFATPRNDLTDVRWTTDNVKTCFIESVDRKIIPDGWLDNHLKLILWKLISYEIRFSNTMKGVCSVKNVLEQLKYRYDKELYNVERPALRKILEKDDVSTRTMVLAVVGVFVDGVRVNCATNPTANIELLLTDGWYTVKASIDRMLANLVCTGKIAVGRKIATVGAELLNCEQGVSPWEDTSSIRLKLFGNSTRPARWDAKLGYHNGSILSQLGTIEASGGKVHRTQALVVRVYPALHVEKFQDGSTVTRSERLENLHQMKYESERQMQLEKLYEEVEKEFFEQDSSESEGMDSDLKKSMQSGSQINKNMKKSRDPTEFRSHLTESQSARLQDYTSRKREKILEELQKRVQERVQKQGLHIGRNVVTLLKMRVVGFKGVENMVVTKAMISIWRPNDAILDTVKEGAWIDIFNVVPTAVRNSEIQISAGRQSVFHRSKYKEEDKWKPFIQSLKRKCFSIKELVQNPTMNPDFNEIDTIGVVFSIEPSTKDFDSTKAQFQNVYLTDIDKNFVCINFWGGIKKFGYENIFASGNIVACCNLQKRAGNTRKSIPQYRATELSVFTETSKFENVRKITEEIAKSFSSLDKRKFFEDCISIKNNYTTMKQSTISPYRFNTSDYNLTKHKIFIDSPLAKDNLNLTGLDFESSFKQNDTEMSPAMLKQKQRVKEKIAKLKMYGEPPPLSKMYIINKSKNAGSAYKSPLTADSSNVASLKNVIDSPVTSNKLNVESSPILSMNRTFVIRSGANPVKLNFSTTSVGDDKIENNPFEEEFDASPPLSLD